VELAMMTPGGLVTNLVQLRSSKQAPGTGRIADVMTSSGGPKSMWLQITSRCNQTCEYCYMNASRESHDHLSLEQIEHIFKVAQRMGVKTMLISGGEPSIVKFLPEILKSARLDHGFKTALVTNGSGCTEKLARLLQELDVHVQVSMDTLDEEAYTRVRGLPILPLIKRNVVQMLETGVVVMLSVPIMNIVDNQVIRVLDWAIEVGVQNVHVSTSYGQRTGVTEDLTKQNAASVLLDCYEFERQHYTELSIDLIENMVISLAGVGENCSTYCTPMSGKAIEIDAKGNAYYCGAITNIPEMTLGNIFTSTFEADYRARSVASSHVSLTPDTLSVCSTCEYKHICKGGCRSQALYYTGNLYGPVSHCLDLKQVYAKMVDDHRSGRLDDLLDFLSLAYGENLSSHTKCF
jgi:radical SAM protein with 4Fe4S-binding SPASM domain